MKNSNYKIPDIIIYSNDKHTKRLVIFAIIILIIMLFGVNYIHRNYGLKEEVTLEAGIKEIKISDFFKNSFILKKYKIITDINNIDTKKVGDYKISFKHKKRQKDIFLHLIDTTPPTVTFKDVISNLEYKINPDDFIEEKNDLSEMNVSLATMPDINNYKDYIIKVIVTDKYNNKTEKECILKISLIKSNITLELGQNLSKEELLYDYQNYKDYINQEEIDKINASGIGDYEIKINLNNTEFVSKIKIQDTTPPTLELRNITIYNDETISGKDSFIKNVNDASGTVTTNMKTTIDYNNIGQQEIIIEATDAYNNTIEKKATLTILKDTTAPKINGLTTITVNKYTNIDYYSGVSANDEKDGKVEFTVDKSNVNTSNYGTYYATYTARDKAGNIITEKRKIIVNHDNNDLINKINEHSEYAGNTYEEIRKYVSSRIKYNSSWGGNDPIWQGLTQFNGNCYVHALTYQALLEKKGYEVKLIWTTDKSHYWNLVKINGVWRHSDSTPGNYHSMISAETDETRYEHLQGRDWDRNAWPEAK